MCRKNINTFGTIFIKENELMKFGEALKRRGAIKLPLPKVDSITRENEICPYGIRESNKALVWKRYELKESRTNGAIFSATIYEPYAPTEFYFREKPDRMWLLEVNSIYHRGDVELFNGKYVIDGNFRFFVSDLRDVAANDPNECIRRILARLDEVMKGLDILFENPRRPIRDSCYQMDRAISEHRGVDSQEIRLLKETLSKLREQANKTEKQLREDPVVQAAIERIVL